MAPARRRSQTGTLSTVAANQSLGFPADLIHPPQSQLVKYADSVSDRIARLDLSAQRMAEGFGVSFTTFVLNPIPTPQSSDNAALVLAALRAFTHKEERVTLERRSGRWGLYYMRGAPVVGNEAPVEPLPLRDAPLDVRERFLSASETFFREYLRLCEERLSRMRSSIGAADQTIEMIANIRLT